LTALIHCGQRQTLTRTGKFRQLRQSRQQIDAPGGTLTSHQMQMQMQRRASPLTTSPRW